MVQCHEAFRLVIKIACRIVVLVQKELVVFVTRRF